MTAPPPILHAASVGLTPGISPAVVPSSTSAASGSRIYAAVPAPRRPISSCVEKTKYVSYSSGRCISVISAKQPTRSSSAFAFTVPCTCSKNGTKHALSPICTNVSACSRVSAPMSMASSFTGTGFSNSSPLSKCTGFAQMTPGVLPPTSTSRPESTSGRILPTVVNFKRPFSVMFVMTKPTSSM